MSDQPFIERPEEVYEAADAVLPVNSFGALTAGLPQVSTNSDYVIDGWTQRNRDLRKAFGHGFILLYDEQSQLIGSLPVFVCLRASQERPSVARKNGLHLFNRKRGWAGISSGDYRSFALSDREGLVLSDPTTTLVADCLFPDESGALPNDRPETLPRFAPVRSGRIHEAFLWVTDNAAQDTPLTPVTLTELDLTTPRQFDEAHPDQRLVWLTLPVGDGGALGLTSPDVSMTSSLMLLNPIQIELDTSIFSGGAEEGSARSLLPAALRSGASAYTLPDNRWFCGAKTFADPETGRGGLLSPTNPRAVTLRWNGYIRSALIIPPTGKYYFESSFPSGTGAYDGITLTRPDGPPRSATDEWGQNGSFYRYDYYSELYHVIGNYVGFHIDRDNRVFKARTSQGPIAGGIHCHDEIQDSGPLVVGFERTRLPDAAMSGSPASLRRYHYDVSVTHYVNHDMDTFVYDLPMGYEPLPALKNGQLNTDPYPYDYPMDWLSASAADADNHPVVWQLKTRSTFILPPNAQIVSALTVPGEGSYDFAVTCPELNGEPVELAEGEVAYTTPALGIALVSNDSPVSSLAEAEAAGHALLWLADSPALQAAGGRVDVQVDADAGAAAFSAGSTELLTAPLIGTGPWRIVVGTDGSGDPEGRSTAALDFETDQPLPNDFSRAWT